MTEDENAPAFSPDEERTFAAVLDEVIPPSDDGRLPGAGEIGIAHDIEQTLQQTPEVRPVVTQGLSTVSELANDRNPKGFAALSRREKLEVLDEVSAREQAFLPSVMFLAYAAYYVNDRVVEALGLEPRPPHPKGYEVEPDDLSLLEQVRQRPKLYRER